MTAVINERAFTLRPGRSWMQRVVGLIAAVVTSAGTTASVCVLGFIVAGAAAGNNPAIVFGASLFIGFWIAIVTILVAAIPGVAGGLIWALMCEVTREESILTYVVGGALIALAASFLYAPSMFELIVFPKFSISVLQLALVIGGGAGGRAYWSVVRPQPGDAQEEPP